MDAIVEPWARRCLRPGGRADVPAERVAVVRCGGQVVGALRPGRHRLDTDHHLFLADLPRPRPLALPRRYRADVWLVAVGPLRPHRFGGPVLPVAVPGDDAPLVPRATGTWRLRVDDPVRVVATLAEHVDLARPEAVAHWVDRHLLEVTSAAVDERLRAGADLLELLGRPAGLHEAVAGSLRRLLGRHGLGLDDLDGPVVDVLPEDLARLRSPACARPCSGEPCSPP